MEFVEVKARAKINLSIDVIKKREDGYHELKMVMQTVDLHDRIRLKAIKSGIELVCNHPFVPSDSRNLAYKAAQLFLDRYNVKSGVRIEIEKRIPVAAGLAGGSSDAAAVLKGMNELFSMGIENSRLMVDGKVLGADVPYCVKGGTALAEGIGDILTELNSLENVDVVIVKPGLNVSTAWVYKNFDFGKIVDKPDMDLIVEAINNREIDVLARNMKNVLEAVTAEKYQIIHHIKERLVKLGALGSLMSGSGPSVFGIFEDRKTAEKAFNTINNGKWECFLTYMTK
mgnify:CR=1 FL=1